MSQDIRSNALNLIRFRELDHKSSESTNKNNRIRSKNDILKLFQSTPAAVEKVEQDEKVARVEKHESDDIDDNNPKVLGEELPNQECVEDSTNMSTPDSRTVVNSQTKILTPNYEAVVDVSKEILTSNKRTGVNVSKEISQTDTEIKRVFKVLIGKISSRKHKQWDDDGFLEIIGKNAILKDLSGKILGRTSVKSEEIEDGHRMCLGGKEIEIVELASSMDLEARENLVIEPLEKKPKLEKSFVPKISGIRKLGTLKESCNKFEEIEPKNKAIDNTKKIYKVLIGKISTRKHKQWDDDGFLEVEGGNAVLKTLNGKIIGRTSVKEEIEDGRRMCLGGKEIEVVELASSIETSQNNRQEKTSQNNVKPVIKPQNTQKSFAPLKTFGGPSLHFNYKPLIMPNPPVNLEWSDGESQKICEVSVDGCLASVLRPHQREGITFLYKCVMGMSNDKFYGAILADDMGLGKTLQCISLIWILLKKGPFGKPVLKRVLIIAPSSLCGNWNKEFKRWLGSIKIAPYVVEGKNKVKDFLKTPRACVMIISYEMFVRNVDDVKKFNFDMLICDEGHRLKNSEVKALKLLSGMDCKRRILLTGTPVQNELQELYTLANFVNPNVLGSLIDFKRYYEDKIKGSKCPHASEEEISMGEERAKQLHERTKLFILRRTSNIINEYLPQKHELVIFCQLTREQNNLYDLITDYWFNRSLIDGHILPLTIIIALKKVCNHPYLFTSEKSNILDEIMPSIPTALSFINAAFGYSTKFRVVQTILKNLKQTQEKVVLVSYFTQTLDLLERICSVEEMEFSRLDGNTQVASRTRIVDRFNCKTNNIRVFLLSAKAGGVGLNLIGASRLILFDSDWNPANDAQAMARIWREGQKRSVYIYRLLTTGTIEEKIYQRQISKTGLSEAVIDANLTSSLKFSANELKDLFTLDRNTSSVTHDLMDCSCDGTGTPPELDDDSNGEDSRQCQFQLQQQPKHRISINQLSSWQHYKQPLPSDLIKELMVEQISEHITFVFKNSVETS